MSETTPPTCVNCTFAQEIATAAPIVKCRRYPPVPGSNVVGISNFAVVNVNDWCGEWVTGTPAPPVGTA